MADQARFDSAKQNWHDATERAMSAKEKARKSYDEEKEYEMTTDSFDAWASRNAPQLVQAIQQLNQTSAAFFQVLGIQDAAKAKDWNQKAGMLHFHRNNGSLDEGKDKGSNFIIITENDLEQYDQIIEAMNSAK